MTGAAWFLLFLHLVWNACDSWAQHSAYSLQGAVDELHRQETNKYPLNVPPSQQRYFNGALGTTAEQDYWDDDSDFPTNTHNTNRNRQRLNKALSKYLERPNYNTNYDGLSLGPFGGYEFDDDSNQLILEPDEKKRSSYFRERDNKYESQPFSAFRERDTQTTPVSGITLPEHSELSEEFLREIEDVQEREREERYKGALRSLWEKYQQHENNVDDGLLEEKNHIRIPPYYMLMQKKRSYPVLPWLPYSERKKRFPVAKRSTKRVSTENISLGKTDDKVAKELSELFDSSTVTTNDEKKKRSVDDQILASSTHAPAISSTTLNSTEIITKTSPSIDAHIHEQNVHEKHAHNEQIKKEHKHRKRSDHHSSHESREEEEEGSESEDHEDEEGEEEEDEEEFEEEVEERKKKRDLGKAKRLNLEKIRSERIPSTFSNNQRQKKSIDWSKYFGIDRRKKAMKRVNASGVINRSPSSNESNNNEQNIKKHDLDPEQLDNMDRKLQSIEEFIIDETIKYTGAHEGIANPDEIRRLKDHVLSRLATAYSLEKMRRALEKLRQSVEAENHLLRNIIEPDDNSENELVKRLSVKKEQAPLHDLENIGLSADNAKAKEIHSNSMMSTNSADTTHKNSNSNDKELEQVKIHKIKRNGYLRYPEMPNDFNVGDEDVDPSRYEPLNDAYLGNKNYIIGSNQCPLIESIAERCRGVGLLSGDINQELLPVCGVHQICYLCGTTQVACDYQYLAEVDSICGDNNDCHAAARSILMILRGTPSPQLGPRECLKNSCLHSAMREIGL